MDFKKVLDSNMSGVQVNFLSTLYQWVWFGVLMTSHVKFIILLLKIQII
jgi:hypothetical protein